MELVFNRFQCRNTLVIKPIISKSLFYGWHTISFNKDYNCGKVCNMFTVGDEVEMLGRRIREMKKLGL